MSQVSKIDQSLRELALPNHIYLAPHRELDVQLAKKALLSIILEALPKKKVVKDRLFTETQMNASGYNQALGEVKEALNGVFGVEG